MQGIVRINNRRLKSAVFTISRQIHLIRNSSEFRSYDFPIGKSYNVVCPETSAGEQGENPMVF